MKMSNFIGCHNLVIFMSFILLLFFVVVGNSLEAVGETPFLEMSSREDMVEFAGYGEEKLSTVLVAGSLLCEACLEDGQLLSSPLPGASVAVICHTITNGKKRKATWTEGVTDEYGDFIIDLPSHLHAIPNLEKICLVKVLRLPKRSSCHPTFVRKQKRIRLSSVGNGIRTYTVGRMSFLHLTPKSSRACVNVKKRNPVKEISW